jgi:hypothetical protein
MIRDPQHIFVADFGETVVLHTEAGDREVKGIYDAAFFDSSIGETVLDTTQKRLVVRDCDLGTLKREDTITLKCGTFEVLRIEPDGTGFSTVLLTEVTADDD